MIPIIYVAGPFTAPTQWIMAENIREAERLGFEVARLGAMPLIPHANTAHFHGSFPEEFFYEATIQLMRRSDAVIVTDRWEESKGATREVEEAMMCGLPIFYNLVALRRWMESRP